MTIDTEEYTFTFGKYKGEFFVDIIEKDPCYIQWCMESIDWFTLSPDDQDYVNAMASIEVGKHTDYC